MARGISGDEDIRSWVHHWKHNSPKQVLSIPWALLPWPVKCEDSIWLRELSDVISKPIDWRSLVNSRPNGQFQSCLFSMYLPWKAGTGSCLSSFLFQVTYHSDWLVRGRANTWVISPSGGPKWIGWGFQMGYKATNTDLTESWDSRSERDFETMQSSILIYRRDDNRPRESDLPEVIQEQMSEPGPDPSP